MIVSISLLVIGVWIGALFGSVLGKNQQIFKRMLILSAGFLMGICVNEIFPEVFKPEQEGIGLWIMLGLILQIILESLTKGAEHGHMHHTLGKKIPLGLILGLLIHAFLEGVPMGQVHADRDAYLQGILIHNLPISFILGSFLLQKEARNLQSWLVVLLFSLASPMGMAFGQYIPSHFHPYFLALVSGIFLHISAIIIFESNKNHKLDWAKLGLVVLGIALAFLNHLGHEHAG
jgi:zinc and cadmium transporter